jgi:hypothetical protein
MAKKFCEYGAATVIRNGVDLGGVILPVLPADNSDVIYFKDSYRAFERTVFKADRIVHVEIGNLMSYDEVFGPRIL